MTDYSSFAPSRPPVQPGGSNSRSRDDYGGQLAGQVGQMSLGGQYGQQTHGSSSYNSSFAPPSSSSNLPSSSTSYPAPSSYAPAQYDAPSSSYVPQGGYQAANRPRPQLSPVTTTPSGPGGGFSGASYGQGGAAGGYPERTASSGGAGAPPPPRKASLPALPSGGSTATDSGFAEPAPPLPHLPSSNSFSPTFQQSTHSSFASIPHSTTSGRDSNFGGEAVFDGSALAAGGADGAGPARTASNATDGRAAAAAAAKRANPLQDLIATETQFVEDVGVVIKRVAAAWSRSNFPPPALDSMFRAVEAVYRINKTLLGKLLDIGPSPSSPKALGDLLMRWITDLEPAYTRYATTLQLDYDSFAPVQSNPNLAPILSSLSYPPSLPPSADSRVTLDRLFELPVHRVKYYQKLYAKLLRSTQEGRSDHALLVTAVEKLSRLDQLCEEGRQRSLMGAEEREKQERDKRSLPRLDLDLANGTKTGGPHGRSSDESGRIVDSPSSSTSYRSSGATGNSTANTSATNSISPPHHAKEFPAVRVEELERRLNTEQTLDIFSMQPRKCKLQMQPPSLTYTRQLRKASSCSISFYPSCDPSRLVTHPQAVLILLTDLFLICERATSSSAGLLDGQDLWLVYPPLAGKHLAVDDGRARGEIEVTVMRKERLTFRFEDERSAADWREQIEETRAFGMSQPPARSNTASSQSAPSPMSPTFSRVTGSSSSNGHASPLSGNFPQPLPHLQAVHSPFSYGGSPTPLSPVDTSARAFSPDGRLQPQQQPSYLGAPSPISAVARPERKASMGMAPSPSSQHFPSSGSTSSRGPSPLPPSSNSDHGYYQQQGAQYSQQSLPSSGGGSYGRHSPYGHPHPQQGVQLNDFGPSAPPPQQGYSTHSGMPHSQSQPGGSFAPPSAPFAQGGYDSNRNSSSRASTQSYGSNDSSGYPPFDTRGAPPPLPKEMSYNGQAISGRGGPLYATSLSAGGAGAGGGYDSRSVGSGRGDGLLSPGSSIHRSRSADGLRAEAQASQPYRMPSAALEDRAQSAPGASRQMSKLSTSASTLHHAAEEDSPPPSPTVPKEPEKTRIVAEMRCKIFLQQQHSQWKSLGTAKLKLFLSQPSNTKQLVVDSDKKGATLVSTIVLTDGVERVGKTGVAIELSDQGDRTGIVYMLQMKTEQSATGLFEQLLIGSDRIRK